MRLSIESAVVFALALAITTFHAARPAGADPDASTETAAPAQIPLDAMVTGAEVASATAEGLALSLAREGDRMILTIANPCDAAKSVDWDVEHASIYGSMVSRMGPITIPIETKHVTLSLAPGASERIALAAPPTGEAGTSTDAEAAAPAPMIMPISTHRVLVMTHSEERIRLFREAEAAARAQASSANGPRPLSRIAVATTTLALLQLEG
jgi:hypothetical protein